ncbi:TPA: AAA family ATPase [Enterobacter soli]|nr:AAA family ATPase [Enterobacter soli]
MPRYISLNKNISSAMKSSDTVYLIFSTWNDYSYRTLFNLEYVDEHRTVHQIGQIKIGFKGQSEEVTTFEKMQTQFSRLKNDFFSLAESPEFYQKLYACGKELSYEILQDLNCVVVSDKAMNCAREEAVFKKSLLRDVNINTVHGQFKRLVNGLGQLTEFDFRFLRVNHRFSDLYLDFNVVPYSLPPTNIHTIIGRNGLGKTTLLNEMVNSIMKPNAARNAYFEDIYDGRITNKYFSTVISISFSAFDSFTPISDQTDPTLGTCYYYIGLKKPGSVDLAHPIEDINALHEKCAKSVYNCCSEDSKRELWLDAISDLESDTNFRDLNLKDLPYFGAQEIVDECKRRLKSMSSGHAIIFMTISNLIEKLQDKTLILFDEPESHLHPPLLSAFIRALSNLLFKRNGIAIIATHSPVVLQEVPKKCCWVLTRFGEVTNFSRPSIETFAENVGILTKEVFKLEMENSGFHKLLKTKVDEGLGFDEIMREFKNKIGFEGQAILMSMIMLRDRDIKMDAPKGDNHE